jgi:hypothetical protein
LGGWTGRLSATLLKPSQRRLLLFADSAEAGRHGWMARLSGVRVGYPACRLRHPSDLRPDLRTEAVADRTMHSGSDHAARRRSHDLGLHAAEQPMANDDADDDARLSSRNRCLVGHGRSGGETMAQSAHPRCRSLRAGRVRSPRGTRSTPTLDWASWRPNRADARGVRNGVAREPSPLAAPSNNALKLTKPFQVRAPRHSASLHRATCRAARSSLMRASQLNAVFARPNP